MDFSIFGNFRIFQGVNSLSFLSLVVLFYQGKPPKLTKDFPSLPNPLKPWKKQGKHPNNQGNSLLKFNQGNPNNQGKEGQGFLPKNTKPPELSTTDAEHTPSTCRADAEQSSSKAEHFPLVFLIWREKVTKLSFPGRRTPK